MRLTKQSNYAVCALVYCAMNDGNLSRVADIAASFSISELFLFKIIRPLVKGGLLKTTRGRNGGLALAKPAHEITLYDAIVLTEDNFSLAASLEGDEAQHMFFSNSRYSEVLDKALAAFFAELKQVTLADITEHSAALLPVLGLGDAQQGGSRT